MSTFNGALKTQKTPQRGLFGFLADKGYGGFIRLKSATPSADGSHKRPVDADWTNPDRWFKSYEEASAGGRYGVGFALKDLVVVDVDKPDPNFDPEAFNTPYGRTPSGGYHLLFAKPNGSQLRGTTGISLDGVGRVDIRTDGNQIAITEGLYRWSTHKKVQKLPESLKIQLENSTMSGKRTVVDYFRRFVDGEIFGDGERNEALYRLTLGFLSLYRQLRGEDPDDDKYEDLCLWLNDTAVEEPEENYASNYDRYLRYETPNFGLQRFLSSPRVRTGLAILGLEVDAPVQNEEASEPSTLQVFRGSQLIEAYENQQWVVDGVVPEASVVLVSAQPKVGKSTILRQLAHSLADGKDWLNIPVPKRRRVIYYSNDESASLIGRHLSKMQPLYDINGVEYWVGSLFFDDFMRRLQNIRDAVVFVDVVGRWFDDLNDYVKASLVMGRFRTMTQTNNITFVLINHSPRSANRSLGSVALEGGADVVVNLYKEGSVRFVDITGRTEKKVYGLALSFDPNTETYSVDTRSGVELIEIMEKYFKNETFVFVDKIDKSDENAINRLIAMGHIKLRVSAKGNSYFQLKTPYQTVQSDLLRRQEELKDLQRRITKALGDKPEPPTPTPPTQPTPPPTTQTEDGDEEAMNDEQIRRDYDDGLSDDDSYGWSFTDYSSWENYDTDDDRWNDELWEGLWDEPADTGAGKLGDGASAGAAVGVGGLGDAVSPDAVAEFWDAPRTERFWKWVFGDGDEPVNDETADILDGDADAMQNEGQGEVFVMGTSGDGKRYDTYDAEAVEVTTMEIRKLEDIRKAQELLMTFGESRFNEVAQKVDLNEVPDPANFGKAGAWLNRLGEKSQEKNGYVRWFTDQHPVQSVDLNLNNPAERILHLWLCKYSDVIYEEGQAKAATRSSFRDMLEIVSDAKRPYSTTALRGWKQ